MINAKSITQIYDDIQKPSDQTAIYVFVYKLQFYGFSFYFYFVLRSYLQGGEQIVTCHKVYRTLSGVPQGSNLEPLLFLFFINDITYFVTSKKLLFADVLKIYSKITNCNKIYVQYKTGAVKQIKYCPKQVLCYDVFTYNQLCIPH